MKTLIFLLFFQYNIFLNGFDIRIDKYNTVHITSIIKNNEYKKVIEIHRDSLLLTETITKNNLNCSLYLEPGKYIFISKVYYKNNKIIVKKSKITINGYK